MNIQGMNKMKRFLILFLMLTALTSLSGCAATMRRGLAYSYSGPVPERTASAIAQDAAALLARKYPPGRTTVTVRRPITKDGKLVVEDPFGNLLESKLRALGFRIAPNADVSTSSTGDGVQEIVWVVDSLGEVVKRQETGKWPTKEKVLGHWYLRLQVWDRSRLRVWTRVYDETGVATGGFAQRLEMNERNY